MVSRPINLAILSSRHGWKLSLWIEVFIRELTIKVALRVHELFVDRTASQMFFLLFYGCLIRDVEEVPCLVIVYNICQSANGWYKLGRIVYNGTVPLVKLAILVCEFSYVQILLGGDCVCVRALAGLVLIQFLLFGEEGCITRVGGVLNSSMHS